MPFFKHAHTAVPKTLVLLLLFSLLLHTGRSESFAQDIALSYSTHETGMLGLNLIPTARMDKSGTIRAGVSTNDPYTHSFMGFQLAKPLYVSIRQTAEVSNIAKSPNRLYPGLDFKLRLMEENANRPAITIGADSAFGHKRIGSEYISFSKRYNNFDFTAGMAWGRLGSSGHIKNPMRSLSSHFDKKRNFNSEQPQDFTNWFTGPDIGFFGGIEYFTPISGLSLKADYGAHDYVGERLGIDGFDAPDPWSIGFNYSPKDFVSLSGAVVGGEKLMARLSLQDQIFNWPGAPASTLTAPDLIYPRAPISPSKAYNHQNINLSPYHSTGQQIGHSARILSNNTPPEEESLELTIKHMGLKGPTIKLIRSDIESGIINKTITPEEIWQDSEFLKTANATSKNKKWWRHLFSANSKSKYPFRFILDNKLSLSEEDTGPLYRSSVLIEGKRHWPFGVINGGRARVNLGDNLSRISEYRSPSFTPIRSDEEQFANRRFALDQLYGAWLQSLTPDIHVGLTAGYLDEMFAGFGGEILYRPFGKTFAIGAEGWQVNRRNPYSTLNQEFGGDNKFTGHLNLFYEVPNHHTTLFGRVGQYLGEDFGATFGINKQFKNGTKLSGFVTATDQADPDIFGDTTHLYSGISLSLPFGNVPFVPEGSEVRITSAPFARDTGQTLDHPLPLYEVTEPISYRQVSRSWEEILE